MIGGITINNRHVNKLMRKLHAVIDQGTSSTKICLFEEDSGVLHKKPVFLHQVPVDIISSCTGYAEQCPTQIYKTVEECLHVIPMIPQTLSITNQRETVIAWDRTTGEPLHNAICISIFALLM